MENGIQGKVYVTFVVNKAGKVVNPKIARGVDPSLDKEALRIVSSLPLWKPGKKDGRNVNVSYTVPVNFELTVDHISKSSKRGLDGKKMDSKSGVTVSGKVTDEQGVITSYSIHYTKLYETPSTIPPECRTRHVCSWP